jgi:cell division septation protein DedD
MPTALAAPAATILDRSEESATSALYSAAIGPVNNDYYLPIFTRFEAADRAGPSWNWAASLYTLNWMAFRQLWRAALVYVAAMAGAAWLVLQRSEPVALGWLLALAALSFGLPGVYGNALLHAQSRKKMARALSLNPSLAQACAMLNRQAGSRRRFIGLALANLALASLAAAAYLAWPEASTPPLNRAASAQAHTLALGRVTDVPATTVPRPPAIALAAAPGQPASAPAPLAPPALFSSAPVATNAESVPAAELPRVTAPRFFINVGLFANAANARRAHQKLRDAGLAALAQELKTPQGRRTRVRVGPFETQRAADAAVEQIRALKLDAIAFQQ